MHSESAFSLYHFSKENDTRSLTPSNNQIMFFTLQVLCDFFDPKSFRGSDIESVCRMHTDEASLTLIITPKSGLGTGQILEQFEFCLAVLLRNYVFGMQVSWSRTDKLYLVLVVWLFYP
jgi:hypothetical protein